VIARRIVYQNSLYLQTLPAPLSYLHTGTLPRLISFVCHSCENTGGVGVFFPFWFTLSEVEGFIPSAPTPSGSKAEGNTPIRFLTDHCSLTTANYSDNLPASPTSSPKSFICNTYTHPPASVANKTLTPPPKSQLSLVDAPLTQKRGEGDYAVTDYDLEDAFRRFSGGVKTRRVSSGTKLRLRVLQTQSTLPAVWSNLAAQHRRSVPRGSLTEPNS